MPLVVHVVARLLLATAGLCTSAAITPSPCTAPASAQAATAGNIAGRVSVADGSALPSVIVYLEPLDESYRPAPPSSHVAISQKNARFDPPVLLVCVGQTVDFPNDEPRAVQHNVFSKSPAKQFDLGIYKPGASKTVTFDKPGPVQLHCSIHSQMDGVVFVSPTPFFAYVAEDGSFAISGVAPGQYELKTWQPKKRFLDRTTRVSVEAGGSLTSNLELSRP